MSIGPLLSMTSPKPGSRPETSSVPVEMTATRGFGCTRTRRRPTAKSNATWAGPTTTPESSTRSPLRTSPPIRRTCRPAGTAALICTCTTPWSVSSTWTIASAPSGSGAPVMIRIVWPSTSRVRSVLPAGMSPTTGSVTGESADAPATSATLTA